MNLYIDGVFYFIFFVQQVEPPTDSTKEELEEGEITDDNSSDDVIDEVIDLVDDATDDDEVSVLTIVSPQAKKTSSRRQLRENLRKRWTSNSAVTKSTAESRQILDLQRSSSSRQIKVKEIGRINSTPIGSPANLSVMEASQTSQLVNAGSPEIMFAGTSSQTVNSGSSGPAIARSSAQTLNSFSSQPGLTGSSQPVISGSSQPVIVETSEPVISGSGLSHSVNTESDDQDSDDQRMLIDEDRSSSSSSKR